jgi:hypothetical protein
MAPNPLILSADDLKRLPMPKIAIGAIPQAAPIIAPPDPNVPVLPSAPGPIVTKMPDAAIANTRADLLGHQQELARLNDTGSGISQIKNPFLRTLAKIGDTAESIIAPRAAAFTPGTEMNHQRLLNQETGRIGNDLGQQYQQAQTEQEGALTDYTRQRPDIARAGLQQKVQTAREKYTADLRKRGINVTGYDEDTGLPTTEDDPDTMAYHQAAAETFIHEANAQKAKVLADIAKNKYLPGTPEYEREMETIHRLERQQQIALASVGLRAQSVQLRRNDQNANFYGLGPDGNPLPNAPQFEDDEGNVTTGGLKGASTAIKAQGKAGQFKDLGGSIQHAYESLEALHNNGGDLSDPRVVAAMSDPNSMIGKVLNGKIVKGGLSDQQVKAIGALNQLREQAGILRQSTGGTAAEAQAQRILETIPTAGDTRATARNKFDELNAVYGRLAPSVVTTAGGLSVGGRGGRTGGGTGTVMMQAPDGSKQSVPADQVDHYKKLGAKVVQ